MELDLLVVQVLEDLQQVQLLQQVQEVVQLLEQVHLEQQALDLEVQLLVLKKVVLQNLLILNSLEN
jgi:hypothetical protein